MCEECDPECVGGCNGTVSKELNLNCTLYLHIDTVCTRKPKKCMRSSWDSNWGLSNSSQMFLPTELPELLGMVAESSSIYP